MARHPLDPVSLALGAVLVVVAGLWFVLGADSFVEQLVWAGPAALVIVGLALLAASRRDSRRGNRDPDREASRR